MRAGGGGERWKYQTTLQENPPGTEVGGAALKEEEKWVCKPLASEQEEGHLLTTSLTPKRQRVGVLGKNVRLIEVSER